MALDILDENDLPGREGPGNSPGRFQVMIRLEKGLPEQALNGIANAHGGRIENLVISENSALAGGKGSVYVLSFPDTPARDNIINAMARRPGVEVAELDSTQHALLASTDTHYLNGNLWGMLGPAGDGIGAFGNSFATHADVAWARTDVSADGKVGSMRTVVGIIDTGIDPLHPDLYLNVWINQNEIPTGLATDQDGDGIITFRDLNVKVSGNYVNSVSDVNGNGRIDADDILRLPAWANGSDNDGNGHTDDLFGWDFYDDDNRPFESYDNLGSSSPADSYHGTHVSGTIGALANGSGVAGVVWDVQLMPLRFLGPGDTGGSSSDAIAALYYYTALGQANPALDFVGTNNSWGGGGVEFLLSTAIRVAGDNGHLFFAAAGNDGTNNESLSHYPSNYAISSSYQGVSYDPIIAVASITSTGARSSFSNYGLTSVDLGAPGSTIASTFAGNEWTGSYTYTNLSGTSMATPHVTGAAALIASEFPGLHPADLRAAILGGTLPTASLTGLVVTGGRLNIPGAIALVGPVPVVTINDTLLSLADAGATVTITFPEAVTNFSASDITVTSGHGSISGLTTANNIVWTATFTPTNVETQAARILVGNRYATALGDFGREGQSAAFTIDRIAPSITVNSIAATRDGTGANVDGTLSAALGIGDTLRVYRDNTLLGSATVTGSNWHFDDTTALANGTYQYTARVADAATNNGPQSGQAPLVVLNADFALALGTTHTGVYGKNFSGTNDADGIVTASFAGTAQSLVLKLAGYDVGSATEVRVLLNGTNIGHLWTSPANTLAPSQFVISAASQLPGTNVLTFQTITPASTWGFTNVTLAPAPATDFTLTPGTTNTGSYGRNFNGTNDADGIVNAGFTGTAQDLLLTLKGYDLLTTTDVKVLLNGTQIGFLAPTPVNTLGNSQFTIPAASQLVGNNVITFASKGATWTWGVTDIRLDPVVTADFALTLGTTHTGVYGKNFSGTNDADGRVTASFAGTAQNLVLKLTGYDVGSTTDVKVQLNGTDIGYLAVSPANTLAPSQFVIPAAAQLPGNNILTFISKVATWTWGITNVTLAPAPATDFTLTPGTTNTGSYGRNFNGTNDADGLVNAGFTGTAQDLLLTLKGYDLLTTTDVKVLLNGAQIGFLAPTPVNTLGNSQFTVPAASQLAGDNVITFASKGATWTWGVTDLAINTIV